MEAAPQKGVNFKQTPNGQLMLVEPDTFKAFLDALPKNERGWIEFRFESHKRLSKRGLFASIHPVKKTG